MRVTVLLGGASDERDVSLATGAQMAAALREAGHEVCAWDTVRGRVLDAQEEEQLRERGVEPKPPRGPWRDLIASGHLSRLTEDPEAGRAEVFALALHGGAGEDGTIQGVLEAAGLAFTGSDRIGCLLAMDKDVSKRLMRDADIDHPAIVMTGYGEVDSVVRAFRQGAVDFFEKPISGSLLIDHVQKVIENDRATRSHRRRLEQTRAQLARLTAREREVLAMLIDGFPNKQIAFRLGLSEKTVAAHRANVLTKMDCDSLAQAVARIVGSGIRLEATPRVAATAAA